MIIATHGIIQSVSRSFNPLSLGNLKAWYKADAGVTLNGSTVSQWSDQSGNNNHMIQASATNQPTFTSNAINSNLPALSFDGANDILSTSSGVVLSNISFYIVYKRNVDSQQFVIGFDASIYPYIQKPAEFQMGNNAFGTGVMTNGTWYIRSGTGNSDGTEVKGYSDNVQIGSTISGSAFNYLSIMSLGDSSFGLIDGDVAELLVFDEIHTTDKRDQVHEYLNGKYSIY